MMMMMMMIRAMSVQAQVMPNDRASADVPRHMDRDFARLFPDPPGGGPYFDLTLNNKFWAFFTVVTFEIALCFLAPFQVFDLPDLFFKQGITILAIKETIPRSLPETGHSPGSQVPGQGKHTPTCWSYISL